MMDATTEPTCRHCQGQPGDPRRRGLCARCYHVAAIRQRYPKVPDPPVGRALCRHCSACKVCRPRNLCWRCYHTPGVKDQYPPTTANGRRGVGHGWHATPPAEPTTAPPGTAEKIAVMAARASRREGLFHEADPVVAPAVRLFAAVPVGMYATARKWVGWIGVA